VPLAPVSIALVLDGLKGVASRHVKPRLSTDAWERLRRLGGAPPPAPAPGQLRRQRWRQMSLTELAQEFGTDKWGVHRYTPHYERHLGHLKHESFTMLEIGIGGYRRQRQGGASLRMWKWFFPKANIVGLDIEDKSFVDGNRITTYKGSQVDEAILRRIVEEQGAPMVVIDDGSHRPEHIRETFRILLPLLPDNAIYIIEDTQTSYWPDYGGSKDLDAPHTTMSLVKKLIDGINHEEFIDLDYQPTYTDQNIVGVHSYHNLVFIEKAPNDEGSFVRTAFPRWFKEE